MARQLILAMVLAVIAVPAAADPAVRTALPLLGAPACLEALSPGRTPQQIAALSKELKVFSKGHPANLRCFVHPPAAPAPPQTLVAAVQRPALQDGPPADVLLIGQAAAITLVSKAYRREPAYSAFVATPLALTSTQANGGPEAEGDASEPEATEFAGATELMPAERWWPAAPFAAIRGTLYLHLGIDLDFCSGFDVMVLRGGRWVKAAGGVKGCHIANGQLDGLGDFDGDGQPERLQLAALPDYPGDGDMAAVHALVPIAPGQRIDWQAPGVVQFYAARWAEMDTDADTDAEPTEGGATVESCVSKHMAVAVALHTGALAGAPAADLKAAAEAALGKVGKSPCWRCAASGADEEFAVAQCKSAAKASRCVLDAGITGRKALSKCWKGLY